MQALGQAVLVWASPRTRGSTRSVQPGRSEERGFPAYAGIDPWHGRRPRASPWLPRVRGDRPPATQHSRRLHMASPRTRGSTFVQLRQPGPHRGFPAYAGIDPSRPTAPPRACRLPRVRGDRPRLCARRWSGRGASPRTRGSTCFDEAGLATLRGFPAYAGIDRPTSRTSSACGRLPRVRGDRPQVGEAVPVETEASPRTRGSTQCHRRAAYRLGGFPAYAGIDPLREFEMGTVPRLPRVRGDRPRGHRRHSPDREASPRTRGSTPCASAPPMPGTGFPAYAGIDLQRAGGPGMPKRLPRVRGDRPHCAGNSGDGVKASPRTRGSTLARGRRPDALRGFPAYAGIDLRRIP